MRFELHRIESYSMDIEEKQAEHIAHFVQQASILKPLSLSKLIVDATSHPSLFAFSEILAVPNILQVYTHLFSLVLFIGVFLG